MSQISYLYSGSQNCRSVSLFYQPRLSLNSSLNIKIITPKMIVTVIHSSPMGKKSPSLKLGIQHHPNPNPNPHPAENLCSSRNMSTYCNNWIIAHHYRRLGTIQKEQVQWQEVSESRY